MIEYVSRDGILLKNASHCNFIGGTSESNGRGLNCVNTGNFNNFFEGIWFEDNSLSDADLYGRGYRFVDCNFGTGLNSKPLYPNVNCVYSRRLQIEGGWMRWIDRQSTSADTALTNVTICNVAGLGVTGSGTGTLTNCWYAAGPASD